MRTIKHIDGEPAAFNALELERLLNEQAAAELLGISADTLRRMAMRGTIRRVTISPRRIGYRVGDLIAITANKPSAA
jgi:hypothetical protein